LELENAVANSLLLQAIKEACDLLKNLDKQQQQ
jgi:hypothetical protein